MSDEEQTLQTDYSNPSDSSTLGDAWESMQNPSNETRESIANALDTIGDANPGNDDLALTNQVVDDTFHGLADDVRSTIDKGDEAS